MATCNSSVFFSNACGRSPFWRKALGVSVTIGSGVCAVHYYGRQCSDSSILSSSSGSIFSRGHRGSGSPWMDGPLPFACLVNRSAPSYTEPSTGVSFPSSICLADYRTSLHQLVGVGLRMKSLFGLKNITVYAFGVYADEESLKDKLRSNYEDLLATNLKENKRFQEDIVASDFDLTVRLIIVYGRLKVGSVRSAFEESIGSRMRKFSGKEDRPLLESFTSLFKDDIKLPKGTIIDVRRQPGHILTTTIDGRDQGSVQSPLLCRAFCDLYIGDEPFDAKAKDDAQTKLAAAFHS